MHKLAAIKIPLYLKILLSMGVGLLFGIIAYHLSLSDIVMDWVSPFGEIFMRLLKAIAIPLVLISLIKGMTNLGNISSFSRLGGRTLLIYVSTTVVAISFGLLLVNIVRPGRVVDSQSAALIQEQYGGVASSQSINAQSLEKSAPLDWLVDIIPENLFVSLSNNGGMLQIIFIAIIIGIAMVMVGREKCQSLFSLLDSLELVVMKVIDIIMNFAPIGVFALMATMVVQNAGNMQLLGALGLYIITVVSGLVLLTWGFYPILLKLFTRQSVSHFIRKMIPVQLLAFSTSSSAATLPLTMETVKSDLGVSSKTASFVLPVGVTINMDGTSLYQAIGVVFIAQIMGVELSLSELFTILTLTTISSIGTPGVPGGSAVILVMVLGSVGIPAEGLALILGMDRPLDMLRTVTNVTGDATVAAIVDSPNSRV